MKKLFLLQALIIASLAGAAQTNVPWLGKIQWINGYTKEISGESILYNSPYPGYTDESLITRATDGKKSIEWETAAVPSNAKGPYVYFGWLGSHAAGSASGDRQFDLYVNDEKAVTFTISPNGKPDWTFGSADSSRVVFKQLRTDYRKDAHGNFYLRLPISRVDPGKPVRIKMIGHKHNETDYIFTSKFSLEDRVDIRSMPFVLKNGRRPISFTAIHFGDPKKLVVKLNKKESGSFIVNQGFSSFEIAVQQPGGKADSMLVEVFAGGKLFTSSWVHIKPVIDRKLYFIHHSHVDVGYNHLQSEVERIQNKNIDDALKLIEATKNYPAEAKFTWNIEAAWVVENWLKQASAEDKQKFIAAVKEGSIFLSAMYANILTGISQPEEVFHYTDFAKQLSKQYGLTINSAMQSDVPGFTWSTVAGLAKSGVKYFSSGPNFFDNVNYPDLGGRVGGFVRTWGDKPVWWVSPSGEQKVLFWTAKKGYSSWNRMMPGEVFEKGPGKIANYLDELSEQQYPYDIVQWRYAIAGDNSIIDTSISRFVTTWNEKYASPKIILGNTEKMFEEFEKKYGDQIPVVKGDISPYWEDGAMSSAEETGKNRVNSLRLQQLSTLYSMLNPQKYESGKFYSAWRNILLFHEHTWGANNSVGEPDAPFVKEQWRIKKGFMEQGDSVVNQLTETLLQPFTDLHSKKIAVFNSSSWRRSGPVILPAGTVAKSVKDAVGKLYPVQKLSDGKLVFIAENIPALGKALYELSDEAATANNLFVVTDNSLSNGKISLTWDANNGSIITLKNGSSFNYAGNYKQQGLNSYWYVPGYDPAKATSNDKVKIIVVEAGPVVTTINIQSAAPGANNLERKISLYANGEQIMIENSIDKIAIRTKEGVHFGFPFDSTLRNVLIDGGYGSVKFLGDQLPGSNLDYVCGRRWMDASSASKGIQLLWLQTPMVEPDNVSDERLRPKTEEKVWKSTAQPTANWFSYAMNNYWYTNSKADQSGVAKFNYALRPHGMVKQAELEQAAAEFTQPLIAIPVKENTVRPGGLFELSNTHISVVSITPDMDGGFTVRLFNPEPAALSAKFTWNEVKPKQITYVQTGEKLSADKAITIAGMDVVEIRIK